MGYPRGDRTLNAPLPNELSIERCAWFESGWVTIWIIIMRRCLTFGMMMVVMMMTPTGPMAMWGAAPVMWAPSRPWSWGRYHTLLMVMGPSLKGKWKNFTEWMKARSVFKLDDFPLLLMIFINSDILCEYVLFPYVLHWILTTYKSFHWILQGRRNSESGL